MRKMLSLAAALPLFLSSGDYQITNHHRSDPEQERQPREPRVKGSNYRKKIPQTAADHAAIERAEQKRKRKAAQKGGE